MPDNTQPNTPKETKVFNLVVELEELKKDKKAMAKGFADEIKRVNAEIKELLDEEDPQVPAQD